MDTLKPSPGILLNPAHPLSRDLIGCWLMNEETGPKVYDCGPNRNTGTLQGNTCFTPGRFGTGLLFDGSGDDVTIGGVKGTRATIAFWCKPINDASVKGLYGYRETGGGSRLDLDIRSATVYWTGVYNWGVWWELSAPIDPTRWSHICVQCGIGGAKLYVNARLVGSDADEYCFDSWVPGDHRIGWDWNAATDRYFNGTIDHVVMYNRTLSVDEIAQLYCEPFAMFKTGGRCRLAGVAGPTYGLLSGSIAGTSSLSARVTACRRMAGTTAAVTSLTSSIRTLRRLGASCAAKADVSGRLSLAGVVDLGGQVRSVSGSAAALSVDRERRSFGANVATRTPWLRDVLFNGMSSSAFQLGTVLTRGWFWTRRGGCSAIYQGRHPTQVNFANSICAVDSGTSQAIVPSHIPHKPGLSYCCVVRRFNHCGHIERTTSATVRLCLDKDGKQLQPMPNPVLRLSASLLVDNRINLSWQYCPLGQETPPDAFHVFWDGGTGRIDLSSPLATVACRGIGLHDYQTGPLEDGPYTFVVQSQSISGVRSPVAPAVTIQVRRVTCQAIQIIGAL